LRGPWPPRPSLATGSRASTHDRTSSPRTHQGTPRRARDLGVSYFHRLEGEHPAISNNALPDIKAKVKIDTTDLDKASGNVKKVGADVAEHIGNKATTHTLRFKESMTSLVEHIGKMPPIVGETARSLESMTSNAAAMGPMGIAAGVAAAGIGLMAEAAHVAQESYLHAAEETHNYMRITGQSAEASSRQIEVFKDLGVGADTASGAMVKLEKAIAQHPATLAKLGIEVVKDSKGNTDMAATLGNVADAYNKTSDSAARMNIVLTAFGKKGADMIPILEQGSAKLRQMESEAKLVMTDADIEQAHKYAIQLKQNSDSWNAVTAAAGRFVQGPVGAATDAIAANEFAWQRLSEAHQTGRGLFSAEAEGFRQTYEAGMRPSLDLMRSRRPRRTPQMPPRPMLMHSTSSSTRRTAASTQR
jgi:hypothetical protein